jgi:cytidylate kinase
LAGVRHPATSRTGNRLAQVIAVDGPSGSGKSSAARGAASALGLRYLDTGAMYRAVTWWMLEHDVDLADTGAVAGHTMELSIDISTDPQAQWIRVDGIDVSAEIRQRRVSNVVSLVAAVPEVRAQLIGQQQAIIAAALVAGGIVAEGRDIGTVVAPDAPVKVYLTASEQVRAERRAAELAGRQAGRGAVSQQAAARAFSDPRGAVPADSSQQAAPSAAVTMAEQAQRDRRDAPQSQMAADAIEIDATHLGLDDVIGRIVGLVAAKRAGG